MNDDTRNRLLNFSETPPASAWPRIADALDAPAFAQKLYHFEATPPAGIWEKVDQHLTPATVIPIRTKLFKIAIAAAVIIGIVVSSIFYFKNGKPDLANANPSRLPSSAEKNTLLETAPQAGAKTGTESASEDDDSKDLAAASDLAFVHFSSQVRIAKNRMVPTPASITPQAKTIINPELPDRYMIATTATGKVVRLPKKAYEDYACAEAYQNYRCKEKIAAIQNKMAASVATDFTDFIDLLKKLQDNP